MGYALDGVGNRTSVDDEGQVTEYVPNEVNEYDTVGGKDYSYDRNGNLLFDWSKQMFYNYANRLAQVGLPGGNRHCYRYDALGRRVEEESFSNQAQTEKTYLFHAGRGPIIAEINAEREIPPHGGKDDGEPDWTWTEYTYVTGAAGEILARYEYDENGNNISTLYYHPNQSGSTMALTDSNGNLIETYEYDVFGAPTITLSGDTNNRFLFAGCDYDTATRLYNLPGADYSPDLGRILQKHAGLYLNEQDEEDLLPDESYTDWSRRKRYIESDRKLREEMAEGTEEERKSRKEAAVWGGLSLEGACCCYVDKKNVHTGDVFCKHIDYPRAYPTQGMREDADVVLNEPRISRYGRNFLPKS